MGNDPIGTFLLVVGVIAAIAGVVELIRDDLSKKKCKHQYFVIQSDKLYIQDFEKGVYTVKYKCDICGSIHYEEEK